MLANLITCASVRPKCTVIRQAGQMNSNALQGNTIQYYSSAINPVFFKPLSVVKFY